MDKDKINSFEFCTFIPMLCSSVALGSGFLYLYNRANKSSIIAMVIGLIISIFFNILVFRLFNTMPEKTISEKIKALVPKWIYYIMNVMLFLVVLSISSFILYRLLTFFNTQFLTDLPKIVLSLILILFPFYASTKNIEVLSRFSSIVIFMCLVSFLFNVTTVFSKIEINNLLPIIDTSYENILLSSIVFAVIFSGPSFMLLSIPKSNISDPKKLKKSVIISYVLSGLMLLVINTWTLGTLGIDVIKLFVYPVYVVLKKIQVFELVNSIENITILIWFFFLIVASSLSLLFSKNIFCETFKINSKKGKNIFSIISSLFVLFMPMILFAGRNTTEKPQYIIYPVCFYGFLIVFTIVVLLLDKLRKK